VSKILIVGGAGYVGGWLTDEAIRTGNEVRVIDNLTYEDLYLKDVDFVFGDVLDFDLIKKNLSWADTVVWLAALVGDPACAINPSLTKKINVESVKNLVNNFDGRVIFPSTCSVYGAQNGLLNEDSTVGPLSLYAASKLEAENILLKSNVTPLIFRLGTLFGISDTYARLRVDLVLNVLTIRAVTEGTMIVFGGEQYRPLLHVRDVATAVIPHLNDTTSGIYNLSAENITIFQLAERIQKVVRKVKIQQTEISFQDARNYRVSTNKVKDELKFIPRWTIEDGIEEVAGIIMQRRIKDIGNPKFNNYESLKVQRKGSV